MLYGICDTLRAPQGCTWHLPLPGAEDEAVVDQLQARHGDLALQSVLPGRLKGAGGGRGPMPGRAWIGVLLLFDDRAGPEVDFPGVHGAVQGGPPASGKMAVPFLTH